MDVSPWSRIVGAVLVAVVAGLVFGASWGAAEPVAKDQPAPAAVLTSAPEPTSVVSALLGIGLATLTAWRKRRQRREVSNEVAA